MGWSEEIKRSSDELINALIDMRKAEMAYEEAKRAYEDKQRTIAEALRMNGLEEIATDSGYHLVVKENVRCSINKNAADRENVARWMEAKGFDAKVKRTLEVPYEALDELKEAGVSYKEVLDINTNSVKAVIKDMLGAGMITQADIPKGCNYYAEDVVEVRT